MTADESDASASRAATGPASAGERAILVVEDNAGARRVVCDTLADGGWRVQAAHNGQQAIDVAEWQRPTLVVLDLALPIRDGLAVSGRLRSAYGDALPILVMGGDGHTAEKATRVGAYALVWIEDEVRRIREMCLPFLRAGAGPVNSLEEGECRCHSRKAPRFRRNFVCLALARACAPL